MAGMGASIEINGVAATSATVPFGSTVSLTNGQPTGIAQRWELLAYPRDIDDAGPDFATNFPGWTAAGDGSYYLHQAASPFAAVTFKPDISGRYRLRLTSFETTSHKIKQTVVVVVVEAFTGDTGFPAAGESTESDSFEGWGRAQRLAQKRQEKYFQGCIRVANVSGGSLPRGRVVKLAGSQDVHTILPNVNPGGTAAAKAEKIPTVITADNTAAGAEHARFAILEETIPNNGTGWARVWGLFEGKTDVDFTTGYSVGSRAFFGASGVVTGTAPTLSAVPIGTVIEVGSSGSLLVDSYAHSLATQTVAGLVTRLDLSIADWDPTLVRYFFVDYDAGNDNNLGYIDAAAGSTFTSGQTGPIAIKTLTRLRQIVPLNGNGRVAVVLIKPRAGGAVYRTPDNSADDDLAFYGLNGYKGRSIVRGSDLTNTTTDRILCGFQTASAGPNGDGSWTIAAGSTTSNFVVAAGTLSAEPTLDGLNVRFVGNVTSSLANQRFGIWFNDSTNIQPNSNTSPAPGTGEFFFIEEPGVAVNRILAYGAMGATDGTNALPANGGLEIVGIRPVNTSDAPIEFGSGWGNVTLVGIHQPATGGASTTCISAEPMLGALRITTSYRDETNTTRAVGSCRFGRPYAPIGQTQLNPVLAFHFINSAAFVGTGTSVVNPALGCSISGCVFRNGMVLRAGGGFIQGSSLSTAAFFIGSLSTATIRRTRIFDVTSGSAGVLLQGGGATLSGLDIQGAGARPALLIDAVGGVVKLNDIQGSTGNTDVGFSLVGSSFTTVQIGATVPTVAGTAGQVKFGDSTFGNWGDFAFTNVPDTKGNHVIGSAGVVCPPGSVKAVTNSSGGQLNPGDAVRVNGTTGQVTGAQADTAGNASGMIGAALTTTANGALGLVTTGSQMYALLDGTPSGTGLVYLSATAKRFSTTQPSTGNQRLRCGNIESFSGAAGVISFHPELVPVTL